MTQPHAVPRPAPAGSELPFGQAGGAVAIGSVLLMATFFTLTAGKVGGQAVLWENAHWTVAALAAALLAYLGYRRSQPAERAARGLVALGLGMYLVGQVAWNLQVVLGIVTVPAVSDVFFLGSAVPIVWGFLHGARARMSAAERTALAIDSVLLLSLTTLIIVAVYAPTALLAGEPLGGAILLLYPIAYIGGAGIAALAGLRLRVGPAWLGINALLGGLAIDGLAWVIWLQQAVTELPPVGSGVNYLFSIATLAMGVGAYRLCLKKPGTAGFERFASAVEVYLPGIAAVGALAVIIAVHRAGLVQIEGWIEVGAGVTVALSLVRQSLLLGERRRVAAREHALRNSEHAARARAEEALVAQQVSEKRYRQMVEVFGRLSEQLSFAAEEEVLIRSGVAALRRLVASDSGDVLLANASQDRLVVASAWGATPGDVGEAVGELAPVRCLGIRRGSVYSVSDAADELMLPCPAHPVERGSLLCVPMLALGQTIGVVHLEAAARDAFNVDDERQAARVAEQVALAIANARLIKTMESMALTDPLTRLHNARFFDPFLDRELASAQRDGRPLGVIMIDLDHFKAFNDENGHPAGDEALRVFARAALAVLRDSDTLARYGGEEFVVAVRDGDVEATVAVAERIRLAVEGSSVEVGLGRYARFTASLGVASTTLHGYERSILVKSADRALYRAKRQGRNRVVTAGSPRISARASLKAAEVRRAG